MLGDIGQALKQFAVKTFTYYCDFCDEQYFKSTSWGSIKFSIHFGALLGAALIIPRVMFAQNKNDFMSDDFLRTSMTTIATSSVFFGFWPYTFPVTAAIGTVVRLMKKD